MQVHTAPLLPSRECGESVCVCVERKKKKSKHHLLQNSRPSPNAVFPTRDAV
jgi:hypothetical protein